MSVCKQPVAPSSVPLRMKGIPKMFSPVVTPRELTQSEIKEIIEQFGHAARLAEKAGFDGVQVREVKVSISY